jgi:hypothetical protein
MRFANSTTPSVVVAVACTLVASALCQIAYHRFTAGSSAASTAECPCLGAAAGGRAHEAQASGTLLQNPVLNAALLNAVLDAREAEPRPPEEKEEPAPCAPADDVPIDEAEVDVSEEESQASAAAAMARLDSQLSGEVVDTFWAPRIEQATTNAARAADLTLDGVMCRETLCRARLSHRDAKGRDDEITSLLAAPELATSQAYFYAPPGDTTTTIYFSRKGQSLALYDSPRPPLPPLPDFARSDEGESLETAAP